MFKEIRYFLFLSFILFSFSACQNRNSGIEYIPKDALGVFSLNLKSLTKKVAWSALADSRILSELAHAGKEEGSFDINATGIDPLSTIYAFGLPDQRLESKFKFLLVLPIKDKKKFEEYLKATFPLTKWDYSEQKTFMFIDQYSCIAWDEHTAIGAFTSPSEYDLVNADEVKIILKEDILKSFSLPKEQSLVEDKIFVNLQKEENDFGFWFNLESFTKAIPKDEFNVAGAILSAQKNLVNNTYITGGLNFKKGKIQIDGKYVYNPSSKALLKTFTDVTYKEDLIRQIPGQQLNLIAHLQLNPKGIPALLDTIGMMPLTNMALKENGLDPESVFNVLEGDFLFSIVDFNFGQLTDYLSQTMEGKSGAPFFQSALSFYVKDKLVMENILVFAVKNKLILKSNSGAYKLKDNYLAFKDKYVVVSHDENTAIRLVNNTKLNDKWAIPNAIKNTPFGLFVDVKNTTKDFISSLPSAEEGTRILKILDNITLNGGKMNGDFSDFHLDISLQNKEENSLLQLIRLKNETP